MNRLLIVVVYCTILFFVGPVFCHLFCFPRFCLPFIQSIYFTVDLFVFSLFFHFFVVCCIKFVFFFMYLSIQKIFLNFLFFFSLASFYISRHTCSPPQLLRTSHWWQAYSLLYFLLEDHCMLEGPHILVTFCSAGH